MELSQALCELSSAQNMQQSLSERILLYQNSLVNQDTSPSFSSIHVYMYIMKYGSEDLEVIIIATINVYIMTCLKVFSL